MPTAEVLLPVRRSDLVVKPVGNDGEHVVKDPRTGAYFKLGPQESFLFGLLDGRHREEEVCRAFSRRFGEPFAAHDLQDFLTLAEESGFLAPPGSAPADPRVRTREAPPTDELPRGGLARPRDRARPADHDPAAGDRFGDSAADVGHGDAAPVPPVAPPAGPTPAAHGKSTGRASQSILYWRVSIFDPDALFNRLEPLLRFVWTRAFVVASAAGIVAAGAVAWLNWRELLGDFPLAWASSWEVLLLAWLTLVIATTLHEFAHGLTCKHFGGEVHELGFLMMFFIPCFYCNVSDAWLLREKSRRLWVTLAGGWCDLCLWAAAVFVWRLTLADTLPHYLAWVVMGVAGARIFFNFNPLLKLDGYYLLSDAADMPNLRSRAWDRFMGHARWLLWGAPRPGADPRGRFLLAFGTAAWVYSVLFLGLMVVGFVHWWGQSWGTIGAAAAVLLGLVTARGAVEGFSNGEVSRMLTSRKGRALAWAACLGALAAAACVVPVQDRAAGPFRLRAAARAELRAPVAGFLKEVYFNEGEKVTAGAVVVRLEVPELDSHIAQVEARRAEARAQLAVLRAGQAGGTSTGGEAGEAQFWQIKATEAQAERLREEQWILRSQRLKQPVASPVAGVLTTARLREKVGQYFREGELICEVEDGSLLEAEVAVPEQEMAHVRPGQRVELKARAAPFDKLTAEVTRVASAVKDPAPAAGGTGAVAAAAPAGIGDVPGRVVVYCRVSSATSPEAIAAVRPGMTGHARIECGLRPVGQVIGLKLMRYVRTEFWW